MSLITIEQLLESLDSELEPRWIAKDNNGLICAYTEKPLQGISSWYDGGKYVHIGHLKLSEFDGKDWTECIYEVPRKTTGKIEPIYVPRGEDFAWSGVYAIDLAKRLNQVIDAVNELKGAKNE